ncbi:hypothetical protein L2E82_13552 [Cichorium intybus]|uniref:Uncharacterized protein n=1 Tax=Cichorium intybus TaxID=13427 RepID=A0ACB9EXL3_CICIN|nr:hypothetical protein L2E82_13552 [Cichorium intybus]
MPINSTQNKRSPCSKLMQLMKSFLELSQPPLTGSDVRSTTSLSPPHNHHQTVKQPKISIPEMQNSRQLDGLDGRGSSYVIKIQGINHLDIGRADDASNYGGMQTHELKASVTNLKDSDYIRRFHEKNKHESVSLVLPPPPPPPPLPRQGRFLLKGP